MAGLAGEIARASDLSRVRVIKKAATESVTSSTTLQNDNDFSVTLDAGKVYRIEIYLSIGGATAGDIKFAWAVTGGVAQYTSRHAVGPTIGVADITNTSMRAGVHNLSTSVPVGVEATAGSHQENFLVETTTSGTSGTLTLQWAQNTSNATASTVGASSYMVITEVTEI